MHVVFRESHGLEETDTPFDPCQTPADLVVLSFSDSDLGAFAAGWHRGGGADGRLPSLRLCNLVALRHPASVDNYVEATLGGARGILIRLIGGENYWPYGIMQVQDFARRNGIALAVLPADGREDAALDAHSTLPVSTLRRLAQLCDAGGAVAAQAALAQLALAAGLYAGPVLGAKTVPDCGFYDPEQGVLPFADIGGDTVAVTFYRSYLTAADTAPIDALIAALRARGFNAVGLFVPSLKAGAAREFLADALAQMAPVAIVNATAFSGRGEEGVSPLDAPDCPVFQVALSTARRKDWATSERGLSPADLAMHVVLPEVDGRIFTGVVSFKAPGKKDPHLQFSRFAHRADDARIAAVADRVAGWHRLAQTPAAERRVALVLSTYPGREDQIAHAVGLDALASVEDMLLTLAAAGYAVRPEIGFGKTLPRQTVAWSLDDYRAGLTALPRKLQDDLSKAWGAPETDPMVSDGAFHFPARRCGAALVALQPERGAIAERDTEYHDLARVPRHSYAAFYLWLRSQGLHALVHIGAHGTLEWLPGKAVALSEDCWPEALTRDLPVIYPFIVNDPGEAAQAKRRIGAVTLGHLPPPLKDSTVPDGLLRLERLLDEYSTADGLDPARRDRLTDTIRSEAQVAEVEDDLGLDAAASAAEAITRIDRFVCDIKESQYGDGLHVFGQGAGENDGLLAALGGRRVPSGPSGSPYRGRADVLPTGRNLYAVDPRSVPSRAAHAQGVKLAEELLRRHLQDKGDWPRGLVVDLWGSATMRTAGEEMAMALHLAGLAPRWDEGSERVSGFEILPLALLNRPRIDVTLRVSGLFRDVFPGLSQLFEAGAAALSEREEAPDMNPYLHKTARVFGPKPGLYGMNMESALHDYSDAGRDAAGQAWLKGSEWAIDATGASQHDRGALEARLRAADGFAHVQDLVETDILLAADYAGHEGGFAAAMAHLGAPEPALYHLDHTRVGTPQARTLPEEIARVVRARAANPDWASGMMRHGFRGAAEVAATLDNLAAFAHLTRHVPAHLFDLYYDATLGRNDLVAFMQAKNPAALAEMRARFAALRDAGALGYAAQLDQRGYGGGTMTVAPQIKGWCPGALRPMMSGDGLLVRVRPRDGRLSREQAHGIAVLSARHANGLIDLSSRANLQIRGVREDSYDALIDGLRALGLIDADAHTEGARNVIVTPFHDAANAAIDHARDLAVALADRGAPDLPGKFGFAVDCGAVPVLQDAPADVRLERDGTGRLLVCADGAGAGRPVAGDNPVPEMLALARWFAANRGIHRRMRQLVASAAGLPAGFDAPRQTVSATMRPGLVANGALVALAFGQMSAQTLAALGDHGDLRVTPWRMLLIERASRMPRIGGIITSGDDPLLNVVACTGAPGCAQALGATRDVARALAPHVPAGYILHVSGCAKGCAHPRSTDVTLTATGNGYDLIWRGAADATPAYRALDLGAIPRFLTEAF